MFSEYHSVCIVIAQIDRRGGIIKTFQLNATCPQFMGYIENQVWTGLKGPIWSVTDQWITSSGHMGTSMWTDRQNGRKTGLSKNAFQWDAYRPLQWPSRPPFWTEFLTHACKNITFPQLRLRTVKITFLQLGWQMVMTPIHDSCESFGCYPLFL